MGIGVLKMMESGSHPGHAGSSYAADLHTDSARKYHQAAVFYFGYGVFYLAGVLGQGRQSGWILHGLSTVYAFIFVPLGVAITIGFPYLIWRQIRWFTRVLAVLVLGRAAWLFMDLGLQPLFLGPFFIAAATAWMLARAGWDL